MKSKGFSTKSIIILLVIALTLSTVLVSLVSKHFAQKMAEQIRQRDISALLGAIESGPLAIARLNSAPIAQDELNKLMSVASFNDRNFVSIQIRGGANASFLYASWSSNKPISDSHCVETKESSYAFADAINPFVISLATNTCYLPPEALMIHNYSAGSGILQILVVFFILYFAAWPVTQSIRQAERFLEKTGETNIESIPFIPVRNLIIRAKQALNLEKSKALGELAEQVAHDIRSPLSAINAVISNINLLPPERAELLEKAISRINSIANGLLEANKSIPKAPDLLKSYSSEPSHIDVYEVAREIFNEKLVQFSSSERIKLKFDAANSTQAKCVADRDDIARALSNLLNNAFESIEQQGSVTLAVRISSDSASLIVHDNGKGIPPEILEKLGTERLSFGKTGTGQGSGLGIRHARATAERAKGRLSIQSSLGVGTIVTMILPIAP